MPFSSVNFVYFCVNGNQDKLVVRKTRLDEVADGRNLERLLSDIRFVSLFRHSNLPWYRHSVLADGSTMCCVFDCFMNAPISDLIRRVDFYPIGLEIDDVVYVLKHVLLGLQYLHSHGIVHGSVMAKNLFLKTSGFVVLSGLEHSQLVKDFKRLHHVPYHHAIFDYPPHAKEYFSWLAPEILSQKALGYSTKSDIYSLSVTCSELFFGSGPFVSLNRYEIADLKLRGMSCHLWTVSQCFETKVHKTPKNVSEEMKNLKDSLTTTKLVDQSEPQATYRFCPCFVRKPSKNIWQILKSMMETDQFTRPDCDTLLRESLISNAQPSAHFRQLLS